MISQPEQAKAREHLCGLLNAVSTGIVVVPAARRESLGDETIAGLAKILQKNQLDIVPHKVFVDQGITVSAGYSIKRKGVWRIKRKRAPGSCQMPRACR